MYKTDHIVVTISRESGSGGRKIGRKLAEKLGWKLYDKELLDMAAEETGYSAEKVAEVEHAHSSKFSMAMNGIGADGVYRMPLNDRLFTVQQRLICEIADQENAVIVGRCADIALADYAPTVSVYIKGSTEKRIQRVMARENLSHDDAEKRMKLIDKTRATYHDYYADTKWGMQENYDLVISSDIGEEATAETIYTYVKSLL